MDDLDKTFDLFERSTKSLRSQESRQVETLNRCRARLREQLDDISNNGLWWIPIAEAYLENADTLLVMKEEMRQSYEMVFSDVKKIVNQIEQNQAEIDAARAQMLEMNKTIQTLNYELERATAEKNRLRYQMKTLGSYTTGGNNELPPKGQKLKSYEVVEYLANSEKGLLTFRMLDERGNIDHEDLPLEIPNADREDDDEIVHPDGLPKGITTRRLAVENFLKQTNAAKWKNPNYRPIKRHFFPKRNKIPHHYHICHCCFRVYLDKDDESDMDAGKRMTIKDVVSRYCPYCKTRHQGIKQYNIDNDGLGKIPFDPFTGLDMKTLLDLCPEAVNLFPNVNWGGPVKGWLLARGYLNDNTKQTISDGDD